jgi:phage-related minor tail protein
MGEAGPEAVMPLQRDSRGRLGVIANLASKGGSAPQVNLKVNVINEGGGGLQVTSQRTTQGADGQLSVDVMVRQVQDALADNVAAGSGSLYHAMGSRFAKQGVM